jgi:cytochrome P450
MFWLPEVKAAHDGVAKMVKVGQSVLDRYRASHSKNEIESDSSIIGHLIRSPYPTELDRIADLTTFILAGHDTTGYQLSWIIIECVKHPDVLLKLRKELDRVFAVNSPIDCTPNQLSELHYLSYIIKEGMRLRPVLPAGIDRKITQDIPYKEFVLPKGSTVSMNFWAIMRTGIYV